MRRLIISIGLLISINSYSQKGVVIYCKPNIKKCIKNLEVLQTWVLNDYNEQYLSSEMYDEYELVITHTISSLEMILKDRNQCDTTSAREDLKYSNK
jgi:hypothetical protein